MSEVSDQQPFQRRPLYIVLAALIAVALLCALVISAIYISNVARNTIPAEMPVDMAGVWDRQGNMFAFCSNSQFPQSLVITEEGNYRALEAACGKAVNSRC